jgi:hypothetical protein
MIAKYPLFSFGYSRGAERLAGWQTEPGQHDLDVSWERHLTLEMLHLSNRPFRDSWKICFRRLGAFSR